MYDGYVVQRKSKKYTLDRLDLCARHGPGGAGGKKKSGAMFTKTGLMSSTNNGGLVCVALPAKQRNFLAGVGVDQELARRPPSCLTAICRGCVGAVNCYFEVLIR